MPTAAASPDELTLAFYQGTAEAYAEASARWSMLRHGRAFAAHLPPGARILDLGCGSGRDLIMLRGLGLDPIGIDYASNLAQLAGSRANVPVVVGDLRRLPFATASFDGAWASASLLHLDRKQIAEALDGVCGTLRLGGFFFASMKAGVGEREEQGRAYTLYRAEEWRQLLLTAGFSDAFVSVETETRPLVRVDGSVGSRQIRWLASYGHLG